jgi:hypothetical protein
MKQILCALLLSSTIWGQTGRAPLPPTTPEPQSQASTAASGDDLAQMRTDLDRMESLLGNMSSEIEFLHDQNLQILLRTNAQLWTMLIRDLRRQVAREEQGRGVNPSPQSVTPPQVPPR